MVFGCKISIKRSLRIQELAFPGVLDFKIFWGEYPLNPPNYVRSYASQSANPLNPPLDKYLAKEVSLGRVAGPFQASALNSLHY